MSPPGEEFAAIFIDSARIVLIEHAVSEKQLSLMRTRRPSDRLRGARMVHLCAEVSHSERFGRDSVAHSGPVLHVQHLRLGRRVPGVVQRWISAGRQNLQTVVGFGPRGVHGCRPFR